MIVLITRQPKAAKLGGNTVDIVPSDYLPCFLFIHGITLTGRAKMKLHTAKDLYVFRWRLGL